MIFSEKVYEYGIFTFEKSYLESCLGDVMGHYVTAIVANFEQIL